MDDSQRFTTRLIEAQTSEADIALGVLWHFDRHGDGTPLSASDIVRVIRSSGGSTPNLSRLRKRLEADNRCVAASPGTFRINARHRQSLDEKFSAHSGPILPRNTGSVLPTEPFINSRKYVKSVVHQINASYDHALFDCCAVMCRRVFETLVIDAFDNQGQIGLIKDTNGEIFPLSRLITVLATQTVFPIGRQTKQAAPKLKNIGDWSAHSRTFIAQRPHIDKISDDLGVACMDLLHWAGQD